MWVDQGREAFGARFWTLPANRSRCAPGLCGLTVPGRYPSNCIYSTLTAALGSAHDSQKPAPWLSSCRWHQHQGACLPSRRRHLAGGDDIGTFGAFAQRCPKCRPSGTNDLGCRGLRRSAMCLPTPVARRPAHAVCDVQVLPRGGLVDSPGFFFILCPALGPWQQPWLSSMVAACPDYLYAI